MNIYIKTFNRPFYLERCINSIFFNVSNYDKIIILDDGTLNKYKERLINKFPSLEWRFSGSDDNKYLMIRDGDSKKAKEKYGDPATFWLTEIRRDVNEYFLLIEDDTWFVNMVDLLELQHLLEDNNSVICKFFWGEYNIKDDLTLTKRYKFWNDLSLNFFKPSIQDISDVYKIYIVAMAIFRKDYYDAAIEKVNHFADETTQLTEALNFYKNHSEITFSKMNERVIYQGWATTVRHDDAITIDIGINAFDFVDALNEAWFNGDFNANSNYPYDYDIELVISLFEKYNIPSKMVEIYKDWRIKPQLNPTTLYYN